METFYQDIRQKAEEFVLQPDWTYVSNELANLALKMSEGPEPDTDGAKQAIAAFQTLGDEFETPLVDGKECAYTVFSETGTAQCGIEKAYKAGAISQNKPISCHLYPVRLKQYKDFTAVNYHQWHICKAACSLGAQQKIPVYEFVKTAFIRKF